MRHTQQRVTVGTLKNVDHHLCQTSFDKNNKILEIRSRTQWLWPERGERDAELRSLGPQPLRCPTYSQNNFSKHVHVSSLNEKFFQMHLCCGQCEGCLVLVSSCFVDVCDISICRKWRYLFQSILDKNFLYIIS